MSAHVSVFSVDCSCQSNDGYTTARMTSNRQRLCRSEASQVRRRLWSEVALGRRCCSPKLMTTRWQLQQLGGESRWVAGGWAVPAAVQVTGRDDVGIVERRRRNSAGVSYCPAERASRGWPRALKRRVHGNGDCGDGQVSPPPTEARGADKRRTSQVETCSEHCRHLLGNAEHLHARWAQAKLCRLHRCDRRPQYNCWCCCCCCPHPAACSASLSCCDGFETRFSPVEQQSYGSVMNFFMHIFMQAYRNIRLTLIRNNSKKRGYTYV